jgi:hypothetical protein
MPCFLAPNLRMFVIALSGIGFLQPGSMQITAFIAPPPEACERPPVVDAKRARILGSLPRPIICWKPTSRASTSLAIDMQIGNASSMY